jgi:hypothetical protein
MELIWREKPEGRTIRITRTSIRQEREDWAEVARQLRERTEYPRSAVVKSYPLDRSQAARDLSASIREGRNSAFRPPGTFDSASVTETDEDGHLVVNVYAEFIEFIGD